ncbi:uncharacterized protein LOC122050630 [Zingiber officinale]|uniref:uncharacterized protein LOC122050630 n=1 Tax=Zingiber officinale TaxID=94328 RepID=UPI001C4D0A25|nr:uncharacterized protein LOC122050630 [Zingiber officinale]
MGTVNSCHNEARIQFEAFQDQRHSVGNILRVHSHDMEIDYRTRLTAMLDVTHFLLKQGLPFRGHDESTSSSNREITLAIINDIGDKFFSLMVDEARDSSVKEHMGVVLRYANKKGCVIERFLAVVHVPDTSSHSLKMAIDALFVQHGLSLSRLRGQGYDGASNMRVIEVLGNVYDDASYSANKGVAAGLIEKMESYQFVFVLHLMKYILGITNELSLSLQQGDQNIVQAMSLVRSVKCRLQDFREDGWQIILEQVNTFCELNMIPILDMEDNMLTRGHGRRRGQLITNFHHYRVEIFCQVVDLIIQEMNNHFSEVSTELLGCISCLHPRNSFSQFDVHKLIHLADFYPEDFCELALVLPVATASVEQVFSAMKIVKTDLHNRMGDEWMNDSLNPIASSCTDSSVVADFCANPEMKLTYGRKVMENQSSIKWDKGKALEF